eukprot:TRINITY_DN6628_c0_g1_i1.p1 TRINITY_DN6628_c0_g1~~TRINITY_DN6628_c0_g1_i1.p1  ORF type:complete len:119 (+),score=25.50 TRINITY_DN6628_c0_g1_i1:39-395(+)
MNSVAGFVGKQVVGHKISSGMNSIEKELFGSPNSSRERKDTIAADKERRERELEEEYKRNEEYRKRREKNKEKADAIKKKYGIGEYKGRKADSSEYRRQIPHRSSQQPGPCASCCNLY